MFHTILVFWYFVLEKGKALVIKFALTVTKNAPNME